MLTNRKRRIRLSKGADKWTRALSGMGALLGLIAAPVCSASDTDIGAFLNNALQKKGVMITKTRNVSQTTRNCHREVTDPPHFYTQCDDVVTTITQSYPDNARVTSGDVLVARDLAFANAVVTQLPAETLIQRLDYFNCNDAPYQVNDTLTVSGTKGWSVSKTHSIASTTSVSLSATFSFQAVFGGSTSISVSQSVSLSDSTSSSETQSTTDSRTFGVGVSVAKGVAGYSQLVAYQDSLDIPFSATVVVDGTLEQNTSGYTKASQLLSEAERTLPFSGVVHARGVSNGFTGNYPPSIPIDCNSPSYSGKAGTQHPQQQLNLPAATLHTDFVQSLSDVKTWRASTAKLQKMHTKATAGKPSKIVTLADGGPGIGHPDGIVYTIVSSSNVTRMDAACGFNDLGVPNGANYTDEVRHYTSWTNGVQTGQWDQDVETFIGCTGGP